MPGTIKQWPSWPEFGLEASAADKDESFTAAKKAVIAEYGAERLTKAWLGVCQALESATDEIVASGSNIIPVVSYADILEHGFTDEVKEQIRARGCLVVRGVVPEDQANDLYHGLREYVADNKAYVRGWPAESPSMLQIYDSPTQNAIRAHPDQLRLQRLLNELWKDETGRSSPDPLIYLDGARDRPPAQPFLGLGPHIDAGSLSRWADPVYRNAYAKIFGGRPEEYDPWDLSIRQDARQDLFPGNAHSSVFRSFQGWTALTRTAPNEGTILLYPYSAAIAYVLLRPFFKPPSNPQDVMDATKWAFDDTCSFFPGTRKPESQRLSRSSHPHLRLEECLVHVPSLAPGDTVWWHSDLCHAVDPEHRGASNSAVVYVPACPTTEVNKQYIRRQLQATLSGAPPPDYESAGGLNEKAFVGYKGHSGVSEEAKRAFGYYL